MINFSLCHKRFMVLFLLFGLYPIQAGKKKGPIFNGHLFKCRLPDVKKTKKSKKKICAFTPSDEYDKRAITEHIGGKHIPYLRCPKKNCSNKCFGRTAISAHLTKYHPGEKLSPSYCPNEAINFLETLTTQLAKNKISLEGFNVADISKIFDAAQSFPDDKKEQVITKFKENGWLPNSEITPQLSGQKRTTNPIEENNPKKSGYDVGEEEPKSLEQILATIDMSIFEQEKKKESLEKIMPNMELSQDKKIREEDKSENSEELRQILTNLASVSELDNQQENNLQLGENKDLFDEDDINFLNN